MPCHVLGLRLRLAPRDPAARPRRATASSRVTAAQLDVLGVPMRHRLGLRLAPPPPPLPPGDGDGLAGADDDDGDDGATASLLEVRGGARAAARRARAAC